MDEIPSHRACASCRTQKVRCIPDESNPDVCQRCMRSGRPCVFTPLQKRKQRKRTDTRVAELEKEMRAMRSMLKQKEDGARSTTSTQPAGLRVKDRDLEGSRLGVAGQRGHDEAEVSDQNDMATPDRFANSGPYLWPKRFPDGPKQDTTDVVDSGMLSMATARQLFETYKNELYPHYPLVYIAPSVTADDLRYTKPALFLAIIAAASGKENADLSAALDKEVLHSYATRSLVQSQKSLELVQALLISAVWYHPPSKFGQLKYYEYIHMAATMAMDIGIGSRRASYRGRHARRDDRALLPATRPGSLPSDKPSMHPAEDVHNPDLSMAPRQRDSSPDTGSIEARRTFLSCYIICAGVSLSLRRPNMLRISSYIRECVDLLEQSPVAVPHDSNLVAWARLIMIAEEISTSFCYDDPGGVASITEIRTRMMIKDFEARLDKWYKSAPEHNSGTGSLLIMYYTVRLYCFEIALHVDHSPEDFRAPYQMGGIQPIEDADEISTQVLAKSVAECITSAHTLLDTFLSMDVESLRALPVFSYVRISFAAFVLAKLSLSAAHPRSRIGRVIDRNSLKVDTFMDRAILHVRNILGSKKSRVPSIFLALLFKLRQWCLTPTLLINDEPDFRDHEDMRIISSSLEKYTQEYDNPRAEDRTLVTGVDGPRITEHSSSSENSPQTSADAVASRNNSNLNVATGSSSSSHSANGTSLGMQDINVSQNAANMASENAMSGNSTANMTLTSTNTLGSTSLDQMNENMLQILGDLGFPEGGLTGLDDWATMPSDVSAWSQFEMMDWQFPSSGGNEM
ncbi:hypothetical protein AC578_442 [Pseudocercospora eumusae]|uniref:Zn(2)-C6 fungal-type domain-containing protein n=1 Tax=Pseudocercospora eumusae TaxID=321146 RepID=A0A139HXY2_9PEZI|nr:hypothetical protein AC578_442 [Pseudocercospora eumusae]